MQLTTKIYLNIFVQKSEKCLKMTCMQHGHSTIIKTQVLKYFSSFVSQTLTNLFQNFCKISLASATMQRPRDGLSHTVTFPVPLSACVGSSEKLTFLLLSLPLIFYYGKLLLSTGHFYIHLLFVLETGASESSAPDLSTCTASVFGISMAWSFSSLFFSSCFP